MPFSPSKALKLFLPATDATIFEHALKTKGICSYGLKNIQLALYIAGINLFIFSSLSDMVLFGLMAIHVQTPIVFPCVSRGVYVFLKQLFLSNWTAAEVNQLPCV